MKSLDTMQGRIIDVGSTIINIKFQYDQPVEPKILSAIVTSLNKQVSATTLFSKQ
jgi:hypothetical protein